MSGLGLHLTRCRLQVKDAKALSGFYTKTFGMTIVQTSHMTKTEERAYLLGYTKSDPDLSTVLELISPEENQQNEAPSEEQLEKVNCEGNRSCYWKIGINVFDLHHAAERLRSAGVKMTDPLAIPNVGLFCHVIDPEGFDTELMQFTFEGSTLPHTKHDENTIGQPAILSVITVRVKDMTKSLRFYREILGMQPLCRQNQTDYGFDIYYLGFTKEYPPNQDLEAIENVEWTYQRPYTLLELVANTKQGEHAQGYQPLSHHNYGFKGLGMGSKNLMMLKRHLDEHKHRFTECLHPQEIPAIFTEDPDGIPIQFLQI